MDKQQKAMTLIEMLVCLLILAVTIVAMVKGYSSYVQLRTQNIEEEALIEEAERLILQLEGELPAVKSDVLMGKWHYTTSWDGNHYMLELWNEEQDKTYDFLLKEAST